MTRGAPGNANLYPCQMASLSNARVCLLSCLLYFTSCSLCCSSSYRPFFSDLRKDFRSDPSFESFGRFELGGEDECVKSGFVDDCHRVFLTSHRESRCLLVFLVHMAHQCIHRILIPQSRSHILTHEICFTIHHTSSDLSKLFVLENCQILHHRGQ